MKFRDQQQILRDALARLDDSAFADEGANQNPESRIDADSRELFGVARLDDSAVADEEDATPGKGPLHVADEGANPSPESRVDADTRDFVRQLFGHDPA